MSLIYFGMPSNTEKARRKALKNSVRDHERQAILNQLPVSVIALKSLFNYLDSQLSIAPCDDSLSIVRAYAKDHQLPEQPVVQWLESNGGYCDCEALSNGEQVLEYAVPNYESLKTE